MKIKLSLLPSIVILVGIFFSLYLQAQIPDGVFFSGDGGLKALLAQQLSSGQFHFYLDPPNEIWVRNLWEQGLYPYEEPFVYQVVHRHYITFPWTFPLITAPFEAIFGYRGLYAIPLISTWAIWGIFYWSCCRVQLKPLYSSVALFILIFASPLSLYSAMYWEHTLAVALAFAGVAMLLLSDSFSATKAIVSGCAIGLSVWFRPEFLVLAALLIILVYSAYFCQLNQLETIAQNLRLTQLNFLSRKKEFFVVSTILTICLFFLLNKLIYNYFLGIHAIQVVESVSWMEKLSNGRKNFQGLVSTFFAYLPITFFSIIYLFGIWIPKSKFKVNSQDTIIYLICFFFTIGISLIVPPGTAGSIAGGKQWGARFLLALVPLIVLISLKQIQSLETDKKIVKYIAIFLLTCLSLVGLQKNIYEGIVYLQKNYGGISPAIEQLENDRRREIAISHQFVAQVLEPPLEDKIFFLAKDKEQLVQLGAGLVGQGDTEFIYICYPFRPCELPEASQEDLQFSFNNQELGMEFSELGKFGKYSIYKVKINEL